MPEFILVTGPNGSGKTTFIEKNRKALVADGYDIIIPDKILKQAHSLYEGNPVMEIIYASLNSGNHFVLETPFQFEGLKTTIDRINQSGYYTTMYQIFINTPGESAVRVQKRFKNGGLYIAPQQVKENFDANFLNAAKHYFYFDYCYIVENDTKPARLMAAFEQKQLTYYCKNESPYLKTFFKESNRLGCMDEAAYKTIKKNKDFDSRTLTNTTLKF